MQIRQTNNSEGNSQIISGNSVPTILTQEINTNVTVPDKSTIVIGGLISNNETRKTSGVPWLSDIPLLGYLFKDTSKSKERDELIIMSWKPMRIKSPQTKRQSGRRFWDVRPRRRSPVSR